MYFHRALITGASSGLGKALALAMAEKGHEVILVGRRQPYLAEIISQASALAKSRMRFVVADLSKDSDVATLFRRCESQFPDNKPIDVLVNCAGYAVSGRVEEIPAKDFEDCWKVNFLSAVSLVRQALPSLRSRRGIIVNVGSGVARRALPFVSPYCSAKASLLSFTDSLRVEVAHEGICVMHFSPGPVKSGFHEATVHRGNSPLAFPPFYGKDPSQVAQSLYRAIEKRRSRVVLGMKASVAHHLNYWFPRFTDWLIGRMYRVSSQIPQESHFPAKVQSPQSLRK